MNTKLITLFAVLVACSAVECGKLVHRIHKRQATEPPSIEPVSLEGMAAMAATPATLLDPRLDLLSAETRTAVTDALETILGGLDNAQDVTALPIITQLLVNLTALYNEALNEEGRTPAQISAAVAALTTPFLTQLEMTIGFDTTPLVAEVSSALALVAAEIGTMATTNREPLSVEVEPLSVEVEPLSVEEPASAASLG